MFIQNARKSSRISNTQLHKTFQNVSLFNDYCHFPSASLLLLLCSSHATQEKLQQELSNILRSLYIAIMIHLDQMQTNFFYSLVQPINVQICSANEEYATLENVFYWQTKLFKAVRTDCCRIDAGFSESTYIGILRRVYIYSLSEAVQQQKQI